MFSVVRTVLDFNPNLVSTWYLPLNHRNTLNEASLTTGHKFVCFLTNPNDRLVTLTLHIKWHIVPFLSQNTALRGNLRGPLNISAWLCKSVCSAHNKRCLGLNVLEKGRKNLYGADPCCFEMNSIDDECSYPTVLFILWPCLWTPQLWSWSLPGPVLDSGFGDDRGLSDAWLVPTWLLINSPGNRKWQGLMGSPCGSVPQSLQQYLWGWLYVALSCFSGPAGFRDRQWLRSIWLRSFSCECGVFDLQALILKGFFSVVLQTYQRKNRDPWGP